MRSNCSHRRWNWRHTRLPSPMISEVVLDAEVKIGTLTAKIQKAERLRTDLLPDSAVGQTKVGQTKPNGFNATWRRSQGVVWLGIVWHGVVRRDLACIKIVGTALIHKALKTRCCIGRRVCSLSIFCMCFCCLADGTCRSLHRHQKGQRCAF